MTILDEKIVLYYNYQSGWLREIRESEEKQNRELKEAVRFGASSIFIKPEMALFYWNDYDIKTIIASQKGFNSLLDIFNGKDEKLSPSDFYETGSNMLPYGNIINYHIPIIGITENNSLFLHWEKPVGGIGIKKDGLDYIAELLNQGASLF